MQRLTLTLLVTLLSLSMGRAQQILDLGGEWTVTLADGGAKQHISLPSTLDGAGLGEVSTLAHFPTDMHSDWQWWNLVKRSRVMVLDSIAPVKPIVESIDNFVNNRRLAQ